MITRDNLEEVLMALGFVRNEQRPFYTRLYGHAAMSVDMDEGRLIYPDAVKLNDATTSNFAHNENFVVYECVCRLLDKGYRAEHLELEPRWVVGHEAAGGKADILVRDEEGNPYIIIECKTAGAEYSREKKNTEESGGQLFSYWQQITATRWLALYASDWDGKQLTYRSDVVHAEDDANILKLAEKDTSILTYEKARNLDERYAAWDETYNKVWLNNTLFDAESQAYKVGVPPLRKGKLVDFANAQSIINSFEEILRHNNVSDKENAFNRLIALFICKLVDEKTKDRDDEVEFQYKQGSDTYETLQDRLQRLHKRGMDEFMQEELFYVEADYADRLFQQYTGQRRKRAIEELNETIRKLKFYTNNDFAFKDVHNEELFYQNGKILVEVVQLFQPYRIVFSSKNQTLGDLFEGLLNKGFKQNEGQFFTPTPITRFIWDALPLRRYIKEHGLPRVIDYACGAGHFLTDGIEAIVAAAKADGVGNVGDNRWASTSIYGIEKDYRLARVSKVSMFMNGAGETNIIFGDGLENYPDKGIKAESFDILVANPPYSVQGFKQHLSLKNNTCALLSVISNNGSEIEVLFVERIAQLLKAQGLAAVILPASVLSNDSTSYTKAREQLLQHFFLRAIVAFGSSTFGATGTNTVTLFLERYNEPPRVASLVQDSVEAIMSGTVSKELADSEVLNAYLQQQGLAADDYSRFLRRDMAQEEIAAHPYFKIYADLYHSAAVRIPRKATAQEAAERRQATFYDSAIAIEREKLYYFALVCHQRTLVITAPADNKEQQAFLGYKWSTRRGNEGMQITNEGGKMYDTRNRYKEGTLADAVRKSFAGEDCALPADLQQYAKTYWLRDMLTFSNTTFNKEIATVAKKTLEIKSKYRTEKLSKIIVTIKGNTTKVSLDEILPMGNTPVVTQERGKLIVGYVDTTKPITDLPIILFGDHSCTFKYIDFNFVRGADGTQLIKTKEDINIKYVFYYMSSTPITNSGKYERHMKYLYDMQIPLPPMDVQERIVAECAAIDEEYNRSRMSIADYQRKINDIFTSLDVIIGGGGKRIKDICFVCGGKRIPKGMGFSSQPTAHPYLRVTDFFDGGIDTAHLEYIDDDIFNQISRYTISKEDVYISIAGTIGLAGVIPEELDGANLTENAAKLVIKDTESVNKKYLAHALRIQSVVAQIEASTKAVGVPKLALERIKEIIIPLPPIERQRAAVAEVEGYEAQIAAARAVMDGCAARRQAVLDRYLR